ncbi:MAG TPA: AraC family transcriptional regulator [Gemmatimonadales bacterium]|nr:AraC family transcriptional regulator [Gemmatimonadales bacterium]
MTPPALPESCARGSFASAVVQVVDWRCAGHDTARGVEEHAEGHEIVVSRRGAYYREIAGRSSLVDAGTVTFAHPDEGYRVRHPLPGGDACTLFRLPREEARALLGEPARFPAAHAALDGRGYLLHRLALEAARRARREPAAVLEAEECGVAFLHTAWAAAARCRPRCRRHDRGPESGRRGSAERVARARELVAARYREPLSLADIARAAGCSPYHLSRLFTAAAGVPLWRYVIGLRLRDALERILETRDGLSAIALATGFASQSHFGDAFHREFGCAPGAVRRLPAARVRELARRARIR